MKKTIILPALMLLIAACCMISSCDSPEKQEYYEMKFYSFKTVDQEARLDNYLEFAYLPGLHRTGIQNVGVFKFRQDGNEIKNAIVLLVPFTSMDEYIKMPGKLKTDKLYLEAGSDYIDAPFDDPPYSRIETILLKAFAGSPCLMTPGLESPRKERVYELRSYQGATELLYERKVEMFNNGESELFKTLGFNPVFFGEVISSSYMPHLMYMTCFNDTLSQKEHWKAFREHPDWKVMKEEKRYENTVSNITKYELHPTPYSDY